MLASLAETGVQSDRRQSFRCKNCAQVSFVAAIGRDLNEMAPDVQEQGYYDVLLDLGSQVFVTEGIYCKEKDIACKLLVSVLLTALLRQ